MAYGRAAYGRIAYGRGVAPASNLDVILTPGIGAITVAGTAPTVGTIYLAPTCGAVQVTATPPSLAWGVGASPRVGALTVGGGQPSLTLGVSIAAGHGTIGITGAAASLTWSVATSPGIGALALSGRQPALSFDLSLAPDGAGHGDVKLVGATPSATFDTVLEVANGELPATGGVATIASGIAITVAGALVVSGTRPELVADMAMAPGLGLLTLAGASPIVLAVKDVLQGAGAVTLAGAQPDLRADALATVGGFVGTMASPLARATQCSSLPSATINPALLAAVQRQTPIAPGGIVSIPVTLTAAYSVIVALRQTSFDEDWSLRAWFSARPNGVSLVVSPADLTFWPVTRITRHPVGLSAPGAPPTKVPTITALPATYYLNVYNLVNTPAAFAVTATVLS